MVVVQFGKIDVGQIFQHAKTNTVFDNQIFVKISEQETKFKCDCGYGWNAVNVNCNGAFTVHFCPKKEVTFDPHRSTKWHEISLMIK